MSGTGLGPWETALHAVKELAIASGVPRDETDSWAIRHDDDGAATVGRYDDDGFTPFLPGDTPWELVNSARSLYSN